MQLLSSVVLFCNKVHNERGREMTKKWRKGSLVTILARIGGRTHQQCDIIVVST